MSRLPGRETEKKGIPKRTDKRREFARSQTTLTGQRGLNLLRKSFSPGQGGCYTKELNAERRGAIRGQNPARRKSQYIDTALGKTMTGLVSGGIGIIKERRLGREGKKEKNHGGESLASARFRRGNELGGRLQGTDKRG